MDIKEDVCFVVVSPTLSKVGGNFKFGNTDEQIYRFLSGSHTNLLIKDKVKES